MEATATRRKRTREEVLAWLDAARQSKAAWQKRLELSLQKEIVCARKLPNPVAIISKQFKA